MKNEKVRKNVLLSFKKSKIYSKLKNLIKSPNWQVADKLYFTNTVEQSVNLKLAGNKTSRWSGAQTRDVRISSTRYRPLGRSVPSIL